MPIYDLRCEEGHEMLDKLCRVGERPPCPECGGATETFWRGKAGGVIDDSIPGGIWIPHGICNDDGTPKRYDSHTEINRALKEKGLIRHVRHIGDRGSDKNKNTTRWQ